MSTQAQPPTATQGFIVTRDWRDTAQGVELRLWVSTDKGAARVVFPTQNAVCFVERQHNEKIASAERKPLELTNMDGLDMDGLYFNSQAQMVNIRDAVAGKGVTFYESDIKPADRFLMERFITAGIEIHGQGARKKNHIEFTNPSLKPSDYLPQFKAVSVDIETGENNTLLYSIAVSSAEYESVFMLNSGKPIADANTDGYELTFFRDQKSLLQAFLEWIDEYDPDLIIGWNVINFDLNFIEHKCREFGVDFRIGRGGEWAAVLQPNGPNGVRVARVPGRAVLDGIDTLRSAFWSFESFALDAVAHEVLGRGKLIASGEDKIKHIENWFRKDKTALAHYNLEDCRLVREIFARTELIDFAVQRSRLTGLALGRHGGSVAAFDYLYLPRLHRKGMVAPDIGHGKTSGESPGGYVMDSRPGLYKNVLLLDFKSLYPSIIRTFQIDPFGLVKGLVASEDKTVSGFSGGRFVREGAILPELIESLWHQRDIAKRGNNKALSQAIKIIMNSFYGVLGTTACRFFDPRLASSITRRGHEIITRSRDYIQSQGYQVIYGDTDSLFVWFGDGVDETQAKNTGTVLAKQMNKWWTDIIQEEHKVKSYLEIEFENLFVHFLMPTVRGSTTGSKKRYAGCVRGKDDELEMIFKGLETVRTDWTPLARSFQRELYRRVFFNEPYKDYISDIVARLYEGELDAELVYRKRLRRPLDAYQLNVPPHVQAARKSKKRRKWVDYVITPQGPEPVDNHPTQLDYDHYQEKQLKPVADGVLHFLDTSFDEITTNQMTIF